MRLNDFIAIEEGKIRDFSEWYAEQSKANPQMFPLDMHTCTDWIEQYEDWLSLQPPGRYREE